MSVETDLERALHGVAEGLTAPSTTLAGVRQRARRRRMATRAAGAAAVVAAVLAAIPLAASLVNDSSSPLIEDPADVAGPTGEVDPADETAGDSVEEEVPAIEERGGPDSPDISGEPAGWVQAGATYHVVGIERGDTLDVRSGPSTDHEIVGSIPALGTAVATSEDRVLNGSLWYQVDTGALVGWVDSHHVGVPVATRNMTDAWNMFYGEATVAETILEMADLVRNSPFGGYECEGEDPGPDTCPTWQGTIASLVDTGSRGEAVVDMMAEPREYVVGALPEDAGSTDRWRVVADRTNAGQFELRTLELTRYCRRGVVASESGDNRCVGAATPESSETPGAEGPAPEYDEITSFVDAWSREDADGMRRWSTPTYDVERALALGVPTTAPYDCVPHQNPEQRQCLVDLDGTTYPAYVLADQSVTGEWLVSWVGPYHG